MTPDEFRLMIPEYLSGHLTVEQQAGFEAEMRANADLHIEVEELRSIWHGLGLLMHEQPSGALRARFYRKLNESTAGSNSGRRAYWTGWMMRPAFQIAAAAVIFVGGLVFGEVVHTGRSSSQVAQLQSEVQRMRQLVALSLLSRQSASARLEGVSWGSRMERPDSEVSSALLSALNHDPNVNVRLSAVDALEELASDVQVRKALIDSIGEQKSPLVQIALIDALVQIRDRDAGGEIGRITHDATYDKNVRQRAAWAVQQLGLTY